MCGHVVQRAAVKLLHADCNNLMVRAAGSITGSRWWPPTSGEHFTSDQIFFGISKHFFLQKANIFILMCCPGRGRCWARVRSTCPGTGSSGRTPGRRAWSASGCWRRRASRGRWSSSCSTCSSTRSSSSTSGRSVVLSNFNVNVHALIFKNIRIYWDTDINHKWGIYSHHLKLGCWSAGPHKLYSTGGWIG